MFWNSKNKLQRLEIKLAGVQAKLHTTLKMWDNADGIVPHSLVCDLQNLSEKVARLEKDIQQRKQNERA